MGKDVRDLANPLPTTRVPYHAGGGTRRKNMTKDQEWRPYLVELSRAPPAPACQVSFGHNHANLVLTAESIAMQKNRRGNVTQKRHWA